MWELERFDWASLRSANSAARIGASIEALRTAESDDAARDAYWRIDNEVIVQGQLYEAAVPTACCLVTALGACTASARARIVELLYQLATGTPHASESACGEHDLSFLCRREVLRAVPQVFASFEQAPFQSLDLWVDLLVVLSAEDETLRPRAQWYLQRALRLDVDGPLRATIERAIEEIQA